MGDSDSDPFFFGGGELLPVITVDVEIVAQPPSPADFAAHMFSAEHGYWAMVWPKPRERWRWLYWMARLGFDHAAARMTSPPFEHDGQPVRISGYGTAAQFAEQVGLMRGVDI